MSKEKQIDKQAIEEMAEHLIDIQRNFNDYCAKPCRECDLGGIVNCENHYKAEALYNAGYRKQSEWISVDERLPTCGELVLVSSMDLITEKHGWFYLARYTNLQNDGVRFDDKRWLAEDGGIFGRVTHWMPLPEPPKMKGCE